MRAKLPTTLLMVGITPFLFLVSCQADDVSPTKEDAYHARHTYLSDTEAQKVISDLGVSASHGGKSSLSVTLTNGTRSTLALYTTGVNVRGLAPRSFVTCQGRKIPVHIPNEIILPAGGSSTFSIELPNSENINGGELHIFFISVFFLKNNRVYEGHFELYTDVK